MEIQGWDYAPFQCSSKIQAFCYIIPTREMITFLHINGNLHVPVKIQDSEMYDGEFFARVDKQPMTDFHVVFLPLTFQGYPLKNGTLTLHLNFRCQERGVLTCIRNGCCVR